MSSGADLFVVCKQCGAEVSPYITECPYCGNRLRRRAPKLPREGEKARKPRLRGSRALRLFSRGAAPEGSPVRTRLRAPRYSATAPYATGALVAASCVVWVLLRGDYLDASKIVIVGPLHGDWWKLFTSPFAYGGSFSASVYAFSAVLAVAIFGSLLEHRHGPLLVLALFFAAGATGALAAEALYSDAIVSGANGAALGLLAAWAVPDLRVARSGGWYEGDLLGAGAFAGVLLAMPFARPEASWLAGVVGACLGLLVGLGLSVASVQEEL
jgi:membrane associated rhomboid family serine protease